MNLPKIRAIIKESAAECQQDNLNLKLCLIDDIIRVKRTMWALGDRKHNEFILPDTAAQLFDTLYDMEIPQLECIMAGYTIRVRELMAAKLETIQI